MSKHDEFPTKPDYEAKYKALEQAVKDAVQRINEQKELNNDVDLMYYAYKHSGDILTEQTGIRA